MNYSPLLFSIIKGKWAILPRTVESQKSIIEKMINGGYASEGNKILSEVKPLMMSIVGSGMNQSEMPDNSDHLDSIPTESTLLFNLNGTMLKYGSMCSYGTQEIAAGMLCAASHKNVGSIVVDIDSGGGSADAIAPMVQMAETIRKMGKSIVAAVDLCASAAYYFACNCDEIVAINNISAEIGSIGVMMSLQDYSKSNEANGITDHQIYSNLSDWKNKPFILALEGKYDEIKTEELDPLARRFQESVRAMRGSKLVEETPGLLAGRMFFADQAKEVGLIDHVGTIETAIMRAREIRQKKIVNQYFNL